MLSLPPSVKIYVASHPVDMRYSFDRLESLTSGVLQQDPYSGHLFVFRNRRGDRVKILYWDRTGFCIWYKLLEKGTFKLPAGAQASIEMEAAELSLLLEGIDLSKATRRRRYRRGSSALQSGRHHAQ